MRRQMMKFVKKKHNNSQYYYMITYYSVSTLITYHMLLHLIHRRSCRLHHIAFHTEGIFLLYSQRRTKDTWIALQMYNILKI